MRIVPCIIALAALAISVPAVADKPVETKVYSGAGAACTWSERTSDPIVCEVDTEALIAEVSYVDNPIPIIDGRFEITRPTKVEGVYVSLFKDAREYSRRYSVGTFYLEVPRSAVERACELLHPSWPEFRALGCHGAAVAEAESILREHGIEIPWLP